MKQFLEKLFSSNFMPHGYCYLWNARLVWLHVVSDALIALAYFSIPITLIYFVRKRREDLPFHSIFVWFGMFILACGATHTMEIWNLWHGNYWLSGAIKAMTAMVSITTAVLLVQSVPQALALPHPEAMRLEIAERKRAEQALHEAKDDLEQTAELRTANQQLIAEIAHRKSSEEALRRSEAYLAEAQTLTHTGCWAIDGKGQNVRYWSEEMFRMYGFDPQQGLPKLDQARRRILPEDRAKVKERDDKTILEKVDGEVEFRIVLPDGTVKDIHALAHPIVRPTGELVEVVGTNVDITEQKRSQEALRRSEAYLTESQRLTQTGSWSYNPATGKTTYWSNEMFRICGLDPSRGIPDAGEILRVIHPDDRDRLSEAHRTGFQQKAEFTTDCRLLLQDKTLKYLHLIWQPLFDKNGNLVEYVGTAADVTERKHAEDERERLRQLEAELARINRVSMMGELAVSIAHEVRQPIAAAITSANACVRWLTRDTPDLERAHAAAMRMEKEGTRAAEIISRLQSFYRKGVPHEHELVDTNEVVREMILLLRDEANRYSISVHPELADGILSTMADRVQLQQVFMNLMLNAIEAMKETGGELKIETQRNQDGQLLISVSDTGIGLPSEDQIFDAFFTTKPHGTGMGLAISRSIVESHGGRLWATAHSGPGATFHFTLPGEDEAHA